MAGRPSFYPSGPDAGGGNHRGRARFSAPPRAQVHNHGRDYGRDYSQDRGRDQQYAEYLDEDRIRRRRGVPPHAPMPPSAARPSRAWRDDDDVDGHGGALDRQVRVRSPRDSRRERSPSVRYPYQHPPRYPHHSQPFYPRPNAAVVAVPRSTRQILDTEKDTISGVSGNSTLTEQEARHLLEWYVAVRLEPEGVTIDGDGTPCWRRVSSIQGEDMEQANILQHIYWLEANDHRLGLDLIHKKNNLSPRASRALELAGNGLHLKESDPRFTYTLAQLENDDLMVPDTATSPVLAIKGADVSYSLKVAKSHDRKHKKSKRKDRRHSSSSSSSSRRHKKSHKTYKEVKLPMVRTESAVVHAYFKRSPRPDVCCLDLLNEDFVSDATLCDDSGYARRPFGFKDDLRYTSERRSYSDRSDDEYSERRRRRHSTGRSGSRPGRYRSPTLWPEVSTGMTTPDDSPSPEGKPLLPLPPNKPRGPQSHANGHLPPAFGGGAPGSGRFPGGGNDQPPFVPVVPSGPVMPSGPGMAPGPNMPPRSNIPPAPGMPPGTGMPPGPGMPPAPGMPPGTVGGPAYPPTNGQNEQRNTAYPVQGGIPPPPGPPNMRPPPQTPHTMHPHMSEAQRAPLPPPRMPGVRPPMTDVPAPPPPPSTVPPGAPPPPSMNPTTTPGAQVPSHLGHIPRLPQGGPNLPPPPIPSHPPHTSAAPTQVIFRPPIPVPPAGMPLAPYNPQVSNTGNKHNVKIVSPNRTGPKVPKPHRYADSWGTESTHSYSEGSIPDTPDTSCSDFEYDHCGGNHGATSLDTGRKSPHRRAKPALKGRKHTRGDRSSSRHRGETRSRDRGRSSRRRSDKYEDDLRARLDNLRLCEVERRQRELDDAARRNQDAEEARYRREREDADRRRQLAEDERRRYERDEADRREREDAARRRQNLEEERREYEEADRRWQNAEANRRRQGVHVRYVTPTTPPPSFSRRDSYHLDGDSYVPVGGKPSSKNYTVWEKETIYERKPQAKEGSRDRRTYRDASGGTKDRRRTYSGTREGSGDMRRRRTYNEAGFRRL